MGIRAAGVKGINLKPGDYVVAGHALVKDENKDLIIATQRGAVKKMKLDEFDLAARAKRGVVMLRDLKTNPHRIIGTVLANDEDEIFIQSEKGQTENFKASELRYNDRYSNGSFYMDETESGKLISIWKVSSENDQDRNTNEN